MFKCIRTPSSSEKPYNFATFKTEEDKGNRPNLLLQFNISICKGNIRHVPTQWETSHKKPFPKYDQVQNGILHVMVAAYGPKLFFPCQIPLFSIHFWNVQWAIPPSVPWRLVAHFVTTVLICFSLKAKTNTSKTHSLAADVTISPSFPQSHHLYTSPQLSTDIRALWSTDALVISMEMIALYYKIRLLEEIKLHTMLTSCP